LAIRLREQIRIEVISDQKSIECNILKPLVDLVEEEKVQQAIQQRPAVGSELKWSGSEP
jgi:hypothetical protein